MLTPSGGIVFGSLVYATSKVLTPEDGCGISLWGATVQKEGSQNGAYPSPVGEPRKETRWTKDRELSDIS